MNHSHCAFLRVLLSLEKNLPHFFRHETRLKSDLKKLILTKNVPSNTSKMSNLKELVRLHRELESRSVSLVVIESMLVATVALAAFTGNMLVCIAVIRKARLRSPTYVLIFALALTDVTMSIVAMPLTTSVLVIGDWVYGKETCEFQAAFHLTLAVISLQLMVVISVNRYLCVIKPNLYRKLFTMKKTIVYTIDVSCLACAPTLSPIFYTRESYTFNPGKSSCVFAMESNFVFALLMGLTFIALPFVVMSYLYCRICIGVRSANRVFTHANNNQLTIHVQEIKVTKTLGAVLIGFSCCWLPILVIDQIDMNNGASLLPRQVYLFYLLSFYMSSAINPVLYALMNRAFRAEYKKIITCNKT